MRHEPLVYLIDPEPVQRQRMEGQLQAIDLECRSCANADEFFSDGELQRLGCVLTELRLGNNTALQLVKRLRLQSSSLPVILVTSSATVPLAAQAFKAGLFDVVMKPIEAFQLWECVTRAFEHHGLEMAEADHRNNIKHRISHLTRQELHVLQMVLDGEPNKRIASRLNVSPRTIVFRRKSLMDKMKTNSVAELTCMILSITGGPVNSPSRLTSLLDVFAAASLCETSDSFSANKGSYYQ